MPVLKKYVRVISAPQVIVIENHTPEGQACKVVVAVFVSGEGPSVMELVSPRVPVVGDRLDARVTGSKLIPFAY